MPRLGQTVFTITGSACLKVGRSRSGLFRGRVGSLRLDWMHDSLLRLTLSHAGHQDATLHATGAYHNSLCCRGVLVGVVLQSSESLASLDAPSGGYEYQSSHQRLAQLAGFLPARQLKTYQGSHIQTRVSHCIPWPCAGSETCIESNLIHGGIQ